MTTNQMCFCIPRISVNINKQFILTKIENLELGKLVSLKSDPSHKKILMKMKCSNMHLQENIRNYFRENGYIKFMYQMPWYWKIYLNDRQK